MEVKLMVYTTVCALSSVVCVIVSRYLHEHNRDFVKKSKEDVFYEKTPSVIIYGVRGLSILLICMFVLQLVKLISM